MCGLLGMLAATGNVDKYVDALERSLPCMRHRGPDAAGTWHDGDAAFGRLRLARLEADVAPTVAH